MTLLSEWKQFGEWTTELGAPLTQYQIEQFAAYRSLLLTWNERINLTAIRQPEAIRIRHFLDSLSCIKVTGDLNGCSLIDVGTGAGFPGLPLKILYPELRLTLVESVAKKGLFLQAVIDELGLPQATVLTERAERLGQVAEHREQYDWAVGRAVAELRVLAEYLLPLCRVGGKMLAQKGVGVYEEVAKATGVIDRLGGGGLEVSAVLLPRREQPHYLVTVVKKLPTPKNFPRRVGIPRKRPL